MLTLTSSSVGGEQRGERESTHREERREHSEHENKGLVGVELDIKELGTDGGSDRGTKEEGSRKLAEARNDDGLLQRDGLGRNGGCEGIRNVVGTCGMN